MVRKTLFPILIGFLFLLSGCIPFGTIQIGIETPFPDTTIPIKTPTQLEPSQTPTQSPTESVVQTPEAGEGIPINLDAIQILEPGSGSRVIAPVHIEGMADSTYDQNIVVRIVLDDGTELNRVNTFIYAEVGQRGAFSVDMDFAVSGERQAFIQVFTTNPRDGFISHLSSSVVTLADSGPVDIRPELIQNEPIVIITPAPWDAISGGVAHIEGYAAPSFENHLFIELVDEDNNVLGSAPATVDSPQPGMAGPFSVDISYTTSQARAGRIAVHDPSVVIQGDVHLATVEVIILP